MKACAHNIDTCRNAWRTTMHAQITCAHATTYPDTFVHALLHACKYNSTPHHTTPKDSTPNRSTHKHICNHICTDARTYIHT